MSTEEQIDPTYKRLKKIASSSSNSYYGLLDSALANRRETARELLEDWDNHALWRHFHFLECNIKELLILEIYETL